MNQICLAYVFVPLGFNPHYLAYDQVGSLQLVTDSSGTIIKQVDYDSFGNIISDSNPSFTIPFGFAGGLHDRDTGLVRFGYRDYMPEIGRWTAKDPIDFAAGDSNLYGYVKNDPVNWIDPLGLWQFSGSASFHLPVRPYPAAAGVTAGNLGGGPEITYGSYWDTGISLGVGDFSDTGGNEAGAILNVGFGKNLGAQFTFRKDATWYNPLTWLDGISAGVGIAISLPVTITVPISDECKE